MAVTPTPEQVSHYRELLSRFAGDGLLRSAGLAACALGVLHGIVVRMAADHDDACVGCDVCHELSRALSLIAAHQIETGPPPLGEQWLPRVGG